MEHADAFSRQHSDDMQRAEGLECVLLAATGLFEPDPDISEISRWKISDNHRRRLCMIVALLVYVIDIISQALSLQLELLHFNSAHIPLSFVPNW